LGYRNSKRAGKFYWEQVAEILKLLERYVRSSSQIDIEKYLRICEQLGQEPDPDKMPLDPSDFPEEVQVAFFMFSLLPDNWEGMSGSYLGKHWEGIEYFFNIYEVQDPTTVLYFMKHYESLIVKVKFEEAEKRRKAEERKSKSSGGGKQYTHNVRG
jgi:hypothetical protein